MPGREFTYRRNEDNRSLEGKKRRSGNRKSGGGVVSRLDGSAREDRTDRATVHEMEPRTMEEEAVERYG